MSSELMEKEQISRETGEMGQNTEPLTPNPSPPRGEGSNNSPLAPWGRGVGGEGNPKVLPSGRSVAIRVGNEQEELEVRSPDGEVEVRITLTAEGPVVHLRGARLQLEATDEVKVQCRKFEVHSTEATELKSDGNINISAQGDVNVQTGQDTRINGRMIYLN